MLPMKFIQFRVLSLIVRYVYCLKYETFLLVHDHSLRKKIMKDGLYQFLLSIHFVLFSSYNLYAVVVLNICISCLRVQS